MLFVFFFFVFFKLHRIIITLPIGQRPSSQPHIKLRFASIWRAIPHRNLIITLLLFCLCSFIAVLLTTVNVRTNIIFGYRIPEIVFVPFWNLHSFFLFLFGFFFLEGFLHFQIKWKRGFMHITLEFLVVGLRVFFAFGIWDKTAI